ncbi:MAG: hypothetical protein M3Y87_02495 [Myxococcota bacterium]|nr:hypothetical protein [Myxococcota bacterium]
MADPIAQSRFRTKGLTYRAIVAHAERSIRGGMGTLRSTLDGPLATFCEQPFLAGSWYDFLPVVPLSTRAAELAGIELDSWLRAASRAAAEEQAHGLYRFLLSFASAESIALWIPQLTARYFDFGSIHCEKVGPGHVRMRREGTPAVCVPWYRVVAPEYVLAAIDLSRKTRHSAEITSTIAANRRDPASGLDIVTIDFDCRIVR